MSIQTKTVAYTGRIATGAIIIFLFLLFPFQSGLTHSMTEEENCLLRAYQNNDVIRLHIIANSDSKQDQKIKLGVRDAILAHFKDICIQNTSDKVFEYWKKNIDEIQSIAEETALCMGFHGKIRAEAGVFRLPEKQYGNLTLPSDDYKTIRIIIGKGNGQNWWCVLYPQLCLSLSSGQETNHHESIFASFSLLRNWLLLPM